MTNREYLTDMATRLAQSFAGFEIDAKAWEQIVQGAHCCAFIPLKIESIVDKIMYVACVFAKRLSNGTSFAIYNTVLQDNVAQKDDSLVATLQFDVKSVSYTIGGRGRAALGQEAEQVLIHITLADVFKASYDGDDFTSKTIKAQPDVTGKWNYLFDLSVEIPDLLQFKSTPEKSFGAALARGLRRKTLNL